MDRRHELIILTHSMAAMQPGQLALRREDAIRLLEELAELQGRHDALREARAAWPMRTSNAITAAT